MRRDSCTGDLGGIDTGACEERLKEVSMADPPRITVEELKRRMDAGEDFTVIDVRNPKALGGNGYRDTRGDSSAAG